MTYNPLTLPPRVIGLTGQKGHGKTLLATAILSLDSDFKTVAFADRLKQATCSIFNLSDKFLHHPEFKERPFGVPIILDEYIEQMEKELGLSIVPRGKTAHSPRELLQQFGTEYVRSVDSDYWVKSTMQSVRDNARDVVLSDVRFANEADAIRNAGGVVVQIVRDGRKDPITHASEDIDFTVDAVFNVRSGSLDRIRDAALATIALNDGPRSTLTARFGNFVHSLN